MGTCDRIKMRKCLGYLGSRGNWKCQRGSKLIQRDNKKKVLQSKEKYKYLGTGKWNFWLMPDSSQPHLP
jgi:hypothetical protein